MVEEHDCFNHGGEVPLSALWPSFYGLTQLGQTLEVQSLIRKGITLGDTGRRTKSSTTGLALALTEVTQVSQVWSKTTLK